MAVNKSDLVNMDSIIAIIESGIMFSSFVCMVCFVVPRKRRNTKKEMREVEDIFLPWFL